MSTPEVGLVFDVDCPHVDEARELLRHALMATGLPPVWHEWTRHAANIPAALRGLGSPTIIVNGVDVSDGHRKARDLPQVSACRIYRHGDEFRGVPPLDMVTRALARVKNPMTPSLRSFNERLAFSCPEMTAEEFAVVRGAYRLLLAGDPVDTARLAARVEIPLAALEAIIERRPGVARFGADGRIRGYLGLSVEPTPHAIEISDKSLWVWCAWDGLFAPRVLGETVRLTSTCPITGEPISLVVAPHGVLGAQPATTVMSFLGLLGPAGNGVGACCPFIHFLQSDDAGKRWQTGHPSGCVLSLTQAWDLARTFVDTKLSAAADVGTDPTAVRTIRQERATKHA